MVPYGELDAAQSIAGLAFYLALGLNKMRREIAVPLVLSAHGNAITLSNEFPPEQIRRGEGLGARGAGRGRRLLHGVSLSGGAHRAHSVSGGVGTAGAAPGAGAMRGSAVRRGE